MSNPFEAAAAAARAVRAVTPKKSWIEDDLGELIGQNPHNLSNGMVIETFGSPKPQVPSQTNAFRRKPK